MRLLTRTFFFIVLSFPIQANATVEMVHSAHREALSIVQSNPIPPPLVAWAFAKANVAANAAFEESNRSSVSYRAAFLETWYLVVGTQNSVSDRLPTIQDSEEFARFGIEVARREWKKSEAALKTAMNQTWNVPDFSGNGRWRPTPPKFQNPLFPNWGQMDLFGPLPTETITRDLLPPAWNSPIAVRELAEVIRLGSAHSIDRTPEQSLIATFWAAGPKTVTPPGMWIEIALDAITRESLSSEKARLLMQAVSMAMADAGVACWNLKFNTLVWRPVTAAEVHLPGQGWAPYIDTPPFPSYVSGHSSFSGAAATVLGEVLGVNKRFDVQSAAHPGLVRHFQSFVAAAEEAGQSRIYGGIHFQSDNLHGLEIGRRSACSALDRLKLGNCR
jgi:membrane-associated phospholipid phosphatase